MGKELTPKQRRFVDEYLIDLNATQAAIRTGYSEKTAQEQSSRLLSNVMVAEAIQSGMDKRSEDLGIDARYVLTTIKETIDRCRQAHPVLDRKGEQIYIRAGDSGDAELVPAFTFDASGVLKGAELLGKHLKLFTEKVEHSGTVGVKFIVEE